MIHRQAEILEWARERGILDHSTGEKQMAKFREELGETREGVIAEDRDEVIDGIGDSMVCIVIQGHFQAVELSNTHTLSFIGTDLQLMDQIIRFSESNLDDAINALRILASRYSTTLDDCIDVVLPIIQARTGALNEDGVWVKDA